jgi:hypothetical protein
MKPTSLLGVLGAGVIGAIALWAIGRLVIASGQPAIVPPLTWSVALAVLGLVIVGLAWPIRRRLSSPSSQAPVDPFYATRVVLLAKSSALAGATFAGGAGGLLLVFLQRPVAAGIPLWLTVAAIAGAIVLTVGGVVAERWCTLPPDSPDDESVASPQGEPA